MDKIFGKPGWGLLVFLLFGDSKQEALKSNRCSGYMQDSQKTTQYIQQLHAGAREDNKVGVVTTCRRDSREHCRCSGYMHVGQQRTL